MSDPLDPRKLRTMGVVRWVLVVLSMLLALGSWVTFLRAAGPEGSIASQPRYQCPMHPSIVSNQPGSCPICGMALVPIDKLRTEASSSAASPDGGPPGLAPVDLTLDRLQSIGVRFEVATEKSASRVVRVTASIAPPEQGFAEVHVRTPGFVERVAARETGARVAAGQELFAMYSPEIWQAEAEMLTSKSLAGAAFSSDAGAPLGEKITGASRQKLEILGMPSRAIDEVLASGKPMRAISVTAPAAGWITKKNVVLGSYVTPEAVLYEIVDLSRVYVVADVFANDLGDVRVGSSGTFTAMGRADLTASATVDLVYPRANPEPRTTRVRMQIANDKRRFLPGQVGTVEIAREAHRGVFVPRDAVVDTGEHQYVFVDAGNGRLVPRSVVLGGAEREETEIVSGIAAGERVVSGATFLVDSESRLRAALAQAQHGADGGAHAP